MRDFVKHAADLLNFDENFVCQVFEHKSNHVSEQSDNDEYDEYVDKKLIASIWFKLNYLTLILINNQY